MEDKTKQALLLKEIIGKIKSQYTQEAIVKEHGVQLSEFDAVLRAQIIKQCFPHHIEDKWVKSLRRTQVVQCCLNKEIPRHYKKELLYNLLVNVTDTEDTLYQELSDVLIQSGEFIGDETLINSASLLSIAANKDKIWMMDLLEKKEISLDTYCQEPLLLYIVKGYHLQAPDSYVRHLVPKYAQGTQLDPQGENIYFYLIRSLAQRQHLIKEPYGHTIKKEYLEYISNYDIPTDCLNHLGQSALYRLEELITTQKHEDTEEKLQDDISHIKDCLSYFLARADIDFHQPDLTGKRFVEVLAHLKMIPLWETFQHLDIGWELANLEERNCFDIVISPGVATFFLELHKWLPQLTKYLNDCLNKRNDEEDTPAPSLLAKHLRAWCENHDKNHNGFIAKILQVLMEPATTEEVKTGKNINKEESKEEKNEIALFSEEDYTNFIKHLGKNSERKRSQDFVEAVNKKQISTIKKFSMSQNLLDSICHLREKFPHFLEVIEHIENHCILQSKGNGVFYLPPMLLAGGPGIGKTFFCHTVAQLVKTYFSVFNMESMTANFALTGCSETWSQASTGGVFNGLVYEDNINPIYLLDELDKAKGSANYEPSKALLPLLEKYTAKKFKDECVPIALDASHIVWVATANEVASISAPLKSRFDIFNVPNPTMQQRQSLISGIYESILDNNSWGKYLKRELVAEVSLPLAKMNVSGAARDLRRLLTTACAAAVKQDRDYLTPTDLPSFSEQVIMPWDESIA